MTTPLPRAPARWNRDAKWGETPARYWIDTNETGRRLSILNSRYNSVGIHNDGRGHTIDFTDDRQLTAVG